MRRRAAPFALALLSGVSAALTAPNAGAEESGPRAFLPRFDLDTARLPFRKAERDLVRAEIHGEYQLRAQLQSDVPLLAPTSEPAANSLGQKRLVTHWLRLTGHFQIKDSVELVGQIEVPRGFFGDTTRHVTAARDPMDEANPVGLDARFLYVDIWTRIGLFRLGQQPNHFGMGMLANDGDHPALFGDYRRGDASERVLFATRPLGEKSPLAVFIAGDLVFRDQNARLADGDIAFQGLLGFLLGDEHTNLGAFGVLRHQTRSRESTGPLTPFTEHLDAKILDVNGRFSGKAPGSAAYVFGEGEIAGIFAHTNIVRTLDETRAGNDEKIRSLGAAMRLGFAHEVTGEKERWANFTAAIGWGYATGDANPADGTTRRFAMNPNFRVGLVLFDHVLAWKTARAATLAGDPNLVNRPAPGAQLLPTNGGVAGATYVNPTFVFRPIPSLDLKGGVLIASSTSDVVDAFRFGANGRIQNYDGGNPTRRDLGVELDGGIEQRIALDFGMTLQLGAQAGVLFPGHAFDDASGNRMATQFLTMGRVGMLF